MTRSLKPGPESSAFALELLHGPEPILYSLSPEQPVPIQRDGLGLVTTSSRSAKPRTGGAWVLQGGVGWGCCTQEQATDQYPCSFSGTQ